MKITKRVDLNNLLLSFSLLVRFTNLILFTRNRKSFFQINSLIDEVFLKKIVLVLISMFLTVIFTACSTDNSQFRCETEDLIVAVNLCDIEAVKKS